MRIQGSRIDNVPGQRFSSTVARDPVGVSTGSAGDTVRLGDRNEEPGAEKVLRPQDLAEIKKRAYHKACVADMIGAAVTTAAAVATAGLVGPGASLLVLGGGLLASTVGKGAYEAWLIDRGMQGLG